MLARVGAAFVDFDFAALSTVAGRTMAYELIYAILTSAVDARIGSAFIYIAQATCIVIPSWTFAFEAVYEIYAYTSISTWFRRAFVDVCFAMNACESWHALTSIFVDSVNAGCAIATWITVTFVDIYLAIYSRCSG